MRSPSCLPALPFFCLSFCLSSRLCFHPRTFETIARYLWNWVARLCHGKWLWFHNTQSRSFNHSNMADVQTSDRDAKFEPDNVVPCSFVCWYVLKGWTTFSEIIFVKNQKYESGGRLKFKKYISFYGDNSWTVSLGKVKFVTVRDHGHTFKFYLYHFVLQSC
jgi:hypothetical protein